jgi:hypothetical protein
MLSSSTNAGDPLGSTGSGDWILSLNEQATAASPAKCLDRNLILKDLTRAVQSLATQREFELPALTYENSPFDVKHK